MKILYATSIDFPSELTNRIQIVEMAKNLSNILGDNFILGGSSIKGVNGVSIKNFKGSNRSFILSLKYLSFIKKNNITHLFCREEKLLFFIILYNKIFFRNKIKFIYEAHNVLDKKWWYLYLLKNIDKLVTITNGLKKDLKNFTKAEIIVLSDAVNLALFDVDIPKEDARNRLNLPVDKKMVLYSGSLYGWKGVDTLVKASPYLENTLFVIIGGKESHIKRFKEEFKEANNQNVIIHSRVPQDEIPIWLKASDILAVPNSAKENISKFYTSPLKVFEYMASNRVIVASDLPSIREVLNEDNSILVEADNVESLKNGISRLIENEDLSSKLRERAYLDVQGLTWENRSKDLVKFLNE